MWVRFFLRHTVYYAVKLLFINYLRTLNLLGNCWHRICHRDILDRYSVELCKRQTVTQISRTRPASLNCISSGDCGLRHRQHIWQLGRKENMVRVETVGIELSLSVDSALCPALRLLSCTEAYINCRLNCIAESYLKARTISET